MSILYSVLHSIKLISIRSGVSARRRICIPYVCDTFGRRVRSKLARAVGWSWWTWVNCDRGSRRTIANEVRRTIVEHIVLTISILYLSFLSTVLNRLYRNSSIQLYAGPQGFDILAQSAGLNSDIYVGYITRACFSSTRRLASAIDSVAG